MVITAPTRHRPVLKIYVSPLQKKLWEFFAEPNNVASVIEHICKAYPGLESWEVLCSLVELERGGALVPVEAEQAVGIAWPAWRDRV